ncbi:MAG: YggT family protein [Anaerolineae bacterium]|nr:YggT family protein [Anaerolineae bacterium]
MTQERTPEVIMTQREIDREQRLSYSKAIQLFWLAFSLVEALIAIRIVLKLIGADPTILFAAFIYDASYVFLFPFEGLVGAPASGRMVLELSSIIALLVYALLALGIGWLVRVLYYRPRR